MWFGAVWMERTHIYNFHLVKYNWLNVYKIVAIDEYEVKCYADCTGNYRSKIWMNVVTENVNSCKAGLEQQAIDNQNPTKQIKQ